MKKSERAEALRLMRLLETPLLKMWLPETFWPTWRELYKLLGGNDGTDNRL